MVDTRFEDWFAAIWAGSDGIPVPEWQSAGWNGYIEKRQLALGTWAAALAAAPTPSDAVCVCGYVRDSLGCDSVCDPQVNPAPSVTNDALVARLREVLPELEFSRETHVVWRDWLLKDPANEQVNPHAGSAEFHSRCLVDYDKRIAVINEAITALTPQEQPNG